MHKVFGTKENVTYIDREAAYLIPVNNNKVGVIKTDKGYFFLGGGLDKNESPEKCIERECLEETGYNAVIKEKICSAETYTTHPKLGFFHPVQTYYAGELIEKAAGPKETDHTLLWIGYTELKGKMFADMQNWALEQYFEKREPEEDPIAKHYNILINEGNDPVHDPEPLKAYMDKWDGQEFIDKMNITEDKTVLEIGVGTGRLAIRTALLCKDFYGIDISPKTIKTAKKNLESYHNINLICNDFMTYDFNCTFDVIYSSLTFMHIKEKQAAVNKVKQLLKADGLFILSTDKNQSNYIDIGSNIIEIYPDDPNDILFCINNSNLKLTEQYETEFAHIFVCANS